MSVLWADPHSRFTLLFEHFAIEVLQMTQTVKGAMTTVANAMQQMGSQYQPDVQYQPDASARESTSNYFATEEPLLARRAGNARQAAVVARIGVAAVRNIRTL